MDQKETIDALNYLIGTCIDGENGYREAADEVKDPNLKTFLNRLAQQRSSFRGELEGEVLRLGGDPKARGSAGAALHRAWINVRDAVKSKRDADILAECERGDRAALDNYEDVLKRDLPTYLKELVARQHDEIQGAYRELEALKQAS